MVFNLVRWKQERPQRGVSRIKACPQWGEGGVTPGICLWRFSVLGFWLRDQSVLQHLKKLNSGTDGDIFLILMRILCSANVTCCVSAHIRQMDGGVVFVSLKFLPCLSHSSFSFLSSSPKVRRCCVCVLKTLDQILNSVWGFHWQATCSNSGSAFVNNIGWTQNL